MKNIDTTSVGKDTGEFFVVRGDDHIDGPYPAAEAAIASLEDWETNSARDIRIVKTVYTAETKVSYNTKWIKQ